MNNRNRKYLRMVGEYLASNGRQYMNALRLSVAEEYALAAHTPSDSGVRHSYSHLKGETLAQFENARRQGYCLEPWNKPGEPYNSCEEMFDDAAGGHLYFLRGGVLPADHPMACPTPFIDDDDGRRLTYHEIFQAVHDLHGHGLTRFDYSASGEEQAWSSHARLYSFEARPAMTTETRAQSSWFHCGPHLRRSDGSLPKATDDDYIPFRNRPLPPAKATLLSDACLFPFLTVAIHHRIDHTPSLFHGKRGDAHA